MLFSIITVTRNNLAGLRRTHDSLCMQADTNYEWIVIDGASDDGTVEYLKDTATQWVSEPDGGIYDAMNKGIDRARGDYIIFMNAGDTFAAPDVLAKLAAVSADFIYGDSLEDGKRKTARSHAGIIYGMFTHHQAMVYRRSGIGDLRYDTKYKIAADYKFTLEFLRRAQKIFRINSPVCIFEQGGVSQQRVRQGRNEQFLIRREIHTCGWLKNAMIYLMQSAIMALRRVAPGIYWRLKS